MFVLPMLLLAMSQEALPGTILLTESGDLAAGMVEGIHRYLDRELVAAERSRRVGTREQLRRMLGMVEPRVSPSLTRQRVAAGAGYVVFTARWKTFADVDGEGLLIVPAGRVRARVVLIPDVGEAPEHALAERGATLAASGCEVLIPVLIDRGQKWSGIAGIRMTNQSHREWIYRMSFEAGRHLLGYEVEKVLAAVDWFAREGREPVAVAGWKEGGLIALHAAALDDRIPVTLVSGHFDERRQLWREPIDRDLWGYSRSFGDRELAALVKPRRLMVEGDEAGLLDALGMRKTTGATVEIPMDGEARMKRQFDQLVAHTQAVIRESGKSRLAARVGAAELRKTVWEEVIGRLPDAVKDGRARSRMVYDEEKFRGYEVMLDVLPDVYAYGILLVPKGMKAGERRPVVVCQHGLEGRAQDVADPRVDSHYYHRFAVRLAEEGFVTFAPQNPYIGEDRFRQIQRKAHPLKLSLFSFIVAQNQALLGWLGSLEFVDARRIGFYGLSYGGKTAMRVPPLLDGYALSICSGDFNDWVQKVTSIESKYSYMITKEYDMLEWDFAHVVNYSDLANLMGERSFMVERGHGDGVAPDEWVAAEFSKVKAPRAEIEFFDGPHTIHGVGTFAFLRRWLNWPQPQ